MQCQNSPLVGAERPRRGRLEQVWTAIACFVRADAGATLVEYALLVALILLSALASMQFLGVHMAMEFSAIGSALTSAF